MMNFLFAALTLVVSPVQAAPTAAPRCYNMSAVACETFHFTNVERKKNGLAPLQYCERCFAMAQEQSEDMAKRDYFSHARPSSGGIPAETFSQRAQRFGLGWVGENIAQTNRGSEQVVKNWMNSPGHRRNILNKDYTSFAVGYRDGLYTQVFAKNAGQGAPQSLVSEEAASGDE